MEKLASRNMVWVFGAIGLVAIAIVVIMAMVMPRTSQIANSPEGNQDQPAQVTKQEVDTSQLPSTFPRDFPMESGSPILANDFQTATDGRTQATRSFETTKTLAENYKLYTDYFKANGWTVTDTIDQATYKAIGATKGSLSARVSINDNSVTKKKTVDIYISQVQ